MRQLPRVIAHRGASGTHPENTFAAFDQALAEGADGIEMDLQLARDDEVVVFHDHTLRKLGHSRTRMNALTTQELRAFDFGGWRGEQFRSEPLPTLVQVLARYAGRTELLLELKPERDTARNSLLVRRAIELMRAAGVKLRGYVLCFDPGMLAEARSLAPDLRYTLNAFATRSAAPMLHRLSWLQALDLDIRWLKPSDRALLRPGQELHCYTCNTEAQLRCALDAGVDAVITNFPARARADLRRLAG